MHKSSLRARIATQLSRLARTQANVAVTAVSVLFVMAVSGVLIVNQEHPFLQGLSGQALNLKLRGLPAGTPTGNSTGAAREGYYPGADNPANNWYGNGSGPYGTYTNGDILNSQCTYDNHAGCQAELQLEYLKDGEIIDNVAPVIQAGRTWMIRVDSLPIAPVHAADGSIPDGTLHMPNAIPDVCYGELNNCAHGSSLKRTFAYTFMSPGTYPLAIRWCYSSEQNLYNDFETRGFGDSGKSGAPTPAGFCQSETLNVQVVAAPAATITATVTPGSGTNLVDVHLKNIGRETQDIRTILFGTWRSNFNAVVADMAGTGETSTTCGLSIGKYAPNKSFRSSAYFTKGGTLATGISSFYAAYHPDRVASTLPQYQNNPLQGRDPWGAITFPLDVSLAPCPFGMLSVPNAPVSLASNQEISFSIAAPASGSGYFGIYGVFGEVHGEECLIGNNGVGVAATNGNTSECVFGEDLYLGKPGANPVMTRVNLSGGGAASPTTQTPTKPNKATR